MLVLVLVLAFSTAHAARAQPPAMPAPPSIGGSTIRVIVNGTPVRFDVSPVVREGVVFVPLRGVFEEMGATVSFSKHSGQVTAERGSTVVELRVGHKMAQVNGETLFMFQPAIEMGGRTLVPLRFLSEALGANVEWNPVRREVEITVEAVKKSR